MNVNTHQQELYEAAYVDGSGIGVPDPKITDGKFPTGQRILTVGGGTANDLWQLDADNLVVNVDYASSGLLAGLRRGVSGVAANLNSSTHLPFRDGSFDLAICKDILEHLLDPLGVIREVVRVLRKDGEIIISIPNHFYWPMRLRLLFGKGILWRSMMSDHGTDYREWNYMHVRFFTYKGFLQFLEVAGLKPAKFYWDFGTLAYYHNPDMWITPQLQKQAAGLPLSLRAKFGIHVVRPVWRMFNVVFPPRLRSAIVALCPGLLCAGFYVRCVKK